MFLGSLESHGVEIPVTVKYPDERWRENLVQTGLDRSGNGDADDEVEPEGTLEQAQ